jgi:nitrogen regulatory protein PII
MKTNKRTIFVKKNEGEKRPPFEQTHALVKLGLALTIVNDGQAASIVSLANDNESATSFVCHGKGTAQNDVYDVLGFGESKKQVIMSILKEDAWPGFKSDLDKRFAISRFSKGVSVFIEIDSVGGVSVYKFLSNRRSDKIQEGKVMDNEVAVKKNDYDVVFAIVNDGFTDLVMEAAKRAGARGGTIMVAHGTGNKDIEKFFGVVITPEKQIVIILVPSKIKDEVMSNIYKDVGINTKGQGIAFSVPAKDVVGLVSEEDIQKQESQDANNSEAHE